MVPNPKPCQHEPDDTMLFENARECAERGHVPIAICGYSYRLPGGLDNDDSFWDLLANRGYVQDSVADRYGKGEVPIDGFTESPMRLASPYEGHIQDGRDLEFDCSLFGVSVHDAKRMDPQIKMMLMVTWEALQCAGYDQATLHNSRTGVFAGQQTSSAAGWRAGKCDFLCVFLCMLFHRFSFALSFRFIVFNLPFLSDIFECFGCLPFYNCQKYKFNLCIYDENAESQITTMESIWSSARRRPREV